MKKPLKNKNTIVTVIVLVTVFLLLHYFVYLNNASSQVPILQSYTDSPMDLPELVMCEEKKPTYLNPFRKVTFSYEVVQNDTLGGCDIREQAASMFTSEMQPLNGNPRDYWNGFEEDGFGRPQIGYDYANVIFFTVQYILIAAALFFLIKFVKSNS